MQHTGRLGFVYGVLAYAIWGFFPLYFSLIDQVNPLEVVPWRVLMTLLFCLIGVTMLARWSRVIAVFRNPKQLLLYAAASLFLYMNWQLFIIGVITGNILETSLGYFINPLVTILIGVVVRKELLTRLQWVAVGVATVGVLVSAIAYGQVPWIALGLACSFGLYGAFHKAMDEGTDALTGLTVETLITSPLALVQAVLVAVTVGLTAVTFGPGVFVLVLLSGVITAVPLLFFSGAASRLPLSYLGFLQFLTPVISFLYGYLIAGEEMSTARWIGFISVWVALSILIIDMVQRIRADPRSNTVSEQTGPIPLD